MVREVCAICGVLPCDTVILFVSGEIFLLCVRNLLYLFYFGGFYITDTRRCAHMQRFNKNRSNLFVSSIM